MQKVASILITLFLVSGCAVLRTGNKSMPESLNETTFPATEIIENNLTTRDFYIQKAEIQYIDSGTEIRFIANLKYKSGGFYLVSLRTRTGIEAARIYIDRDTVLINDRINRKLFYGSSVNIERKYGVSADAIALIMGDLIIKSVEESILSCSEGKNTINTEIGESKVLYTIDCNRKKVRSVSISRGNVEDKIVINCSDYQYSENRNYPKIIEIEEKNENSSLKIEISKIEFNNLENISFIPGNNYEKVLIK